jgi:phage tail-like protein
MTINFGSGPGMSRSMFGGDHATGGGKAVSGAVGKQLGGVAGNIAGRMATSALGMINAAVFGRQDPELCSQYALEIDGIMSVGFKECKGIEWEAEVVTFREGGNNYHEQHLIGPAKFKPLEIKRGFVANNGEFYEWLKSCVDPFSKKKIERVTISLVVYNESMFEVGRFNFYNAFISKYAGPTLDASSNDISFEAMTLIYDFFDFTPGGALANKLQGLLGKAVGAVKGLF